LSATNNEEKENLVWRDRRTRAKKMVEEPRNLN